MTAQSINAMLDHLTVPRSESEVETWLDGLPKPHGGPYVVSFINAHAVNMADENAAFYDALMRSDILLRDGSGVKLMMTMMDRDPGMNMCGTDLIPRIIERYSKKDGWRRRVAILGTTAPWNEKGAQIVRDGGADVRLVMDGWQETQDYVQALKDNPADLIILAMGMPKQELVSMALKDALFHDCVILNGGAIIDYMSGKVERAPENWRKLGLEWAYRFLKEPGRLFHDCVILVGAIIVD